MVFTVYRKDADGKRESVVGCTDDWTEVVVIIHEDRDKIDWETEYEVAEEGKE